MICENDVSKLERSCGRRDIGPIMQTSPSGQVCISKIYKIGGLEETTKQVYTPLPLPPTRPLKKYKSLYV